MRTEAMPENRRKVLIEGDPEVELRNRVAKALVNADIDLFELRAEAVSLEDIFLRLTRSGAEEVRAARQRILGASPPPRDLPAGRDVLDVVEGKWPGTETDAEIRDALDSGHEADVQEANRDYKIYPGDLGVCADSILSKNVCAAT